MPRIPGGDGQVIRTIVLVGCLTWYFGPYVGEPLRCGGVYDTTHTWIAVDIDRYTEWRCNDLARVTVGEDVRLLRVKDSGPLSAYCVWFGDECLEIVGDLPAHAFPWPGLSVQGSVENVTAGLRERMRRER